MYVCEGESDSGVCVSVITTIHTNIREMFIVFDIPIFVLWGHCLTPSTSSYTPPPTLVPFAS